MISTKKSVQYLQKLCKDLGIQSWVFSPGSRNAPLTLTFCNDSYFDCQSVVDERSAGFIAMGKALALKQYVALSCTSGSAVLNYGPAIAEAFYQKVPLFIVTADRPQKWIGNGEGQSINQVNVFQNYIISSYHLNDDSTDEELIEVFENLACDLSSGIAGPVHLNLAFEEPLYDSLETNPIDSVFKTSQYGVEDTIDYVQIAKEWNSLERIMIVCGQNSIDEKLQHQLKLINDDPRVVVLTESLANVSDFRFVNCIDRTLAQVGDKVELKPQLVITVGEAIVSKKIKQFLRGVSDLDHWHISPNGESTDVFECLNKVLLTPEHVFIRKLSLLVNFESESVFKSNWLQCSFMAEELHDRFMIDLGWSDLRVFKELHDLLPDNIVLHVGNSSPIRYMQLFNAISTIEVHGNRGVSGIDGCTSTALGYSAVSDKTNVLITGDLSFVYDINAFWNDIKANNLKVIIINNGGGGIFRIIPGPNTTKQLASRFEVGNFVKIKNLCEGYGVEYSRAINVAELEDKFIHLLNDQNSTGVLEVFTPNEINSETLNAYFEHIRAKSL